MKTAVRAAVGAAGAAAVAAATVMGGGVASAFIPGASDEGVVVITDSNLVKVHVDSKGEAPTAVTGTITNTGDRALRCAVPGPEDDDETFEYPGQVTEAGVVDAAMDYYRTHIFSAGGFVLPQGGGVLTTGSINDFLPATGSLTGSLMGEDTARLVKIRDMQQAARTAGRTGDPRVGNNTAFNLAPGQSADWVADLGASTTGDRGEWQAAAMFFCAETSAPRLSYVFAGYEDLDAVEP